MSNKITLILFLFTMMLSKAVSAEVIYLDCRFDAYPKFSEEITLDLANEVMEIKVKTPSGKQPKTPSEKYVIDDLIISPSEVVGKNVEHSKYTSLIFTWTWQISREDLSYSRRLRLNNGDDETERGKCKKIDKAPPKRAF